MISSVDSASMLYAVGLPMERLAIQIRPISVAMPMITSAKDGARDSRDAAAACGSMGERLSADDVDCLCCICAGGIGSNPQNRREKS